jgi:hypothetical protein
MARFLIVLGLAILVVGLLWPYLTRLGLGRLPGDIVIERENVTAIGVIYRPETELASHYFDASLPRQFDAYPWFDETRAVTPLPTTAREGVPETYPFGL